MAKGAVLSIKVVSDAKAAQRELDRIGGSAEGMSQKVDRAGKRAGAALAGLGAAGLGAALKAEEVASANARVANVLTQMGYGKATDRVLAYADALEGQLGVDEKVIKQAQASLATFGEVAKSVNQAGGAFDRATMAALDLAAAGFGTAESNAIQLGKALNDPIKGLSALAESGVTFTAAEQKRIKALVESGKQGKAQAIILSAIEKQVGNTAAATADSSAKMKLAFGEVVEELGAGLLPVLDGAAPKVQALTKWMRENSDVVLKATAAAAALAAAVVTVSVIMRVWAAATATVAAAQAAAAAITTLWNNSTLILQARLLALAAAEKIVTAGQWLLNAAMTANPIGLVVLAIAGLVAALVIAYKKSETFRKIVDRAFGAVQKAAKAAFDWIRKNWPLILAIITGPIGLAVLAVAKNWDKIKEGARRAKDYVADKFGSLVGFFREMPAKFGRATAGMFDGLKDAFRGAINWIIDKWNGLSFSLPSINTKIPGIGKVGGFSVSPRDLPRLRHGGVTTGPTLAMIGDNPGGREAVIPLDKYDLGGSREVVVHNYIHLDGEQMKHWVERKVIAPQARRAALGGMAL